jgi:hypothetical protein
MLDVTVTGCRVVANPPRLGRGNRACNSLHPDQKETGKGSHLLLLPQASKAGLGHHRRCEMVRSIYHKTIAEAIGVSDYTVLAEVEEIMRYDVFRSTLDWQTKAQLMEGARMAYEMLTAPSPRT